MREYLKTRWQSWAMAAAMLLMAVIVLFLYDVPLEPVGYIAVLVIICETGFLIWGYRKYRKKQQNLLYIKENGALALEHMEAPEDENEALYQDICRLLDEERIKARNKSSAFGTELMDFYTMWVHQIKTPIAASRLLLQEEELEQILSMRVRCEKVAIKDIKLRTFIAEGNSRNDLAAHVYDITYGSVVPFEDNLVVIDDSIVRGTTLKESIIRILDRLHPKKIVLVGSPEYQNGSYKLGQAEGGRKILLLNVNNFDASDENELKESLHTIVHEFTHILHQTKLFDKKYQEISTGRYNSNWTLLNDSEARHLGFITNYAMLNKDEDFAEMVSGILVFGYDWFKDTVLAEAEKSIENPNAKADLEAKLAIVESYFKETWNIEFFDNETSGEKGLETYFREAIEKVVSNPPTK